MPAGKPRGRDYREVQSIYVDTDQKTGLTEWQLTFLFAWINVSYLTLFLTFIRVSCSERCCNIALSFLVQPFFGYVLLTSAFGAEWHTFGARLRPVKCAAAVNVTLTLAVVIALSSRLQYFDMPLTQTVSLG